MTEKIEKEIEVKAKQITSNLIAFMKELDTEANKQIKELDLDIEFYKKENTELKAESDFYNKERGNYKALYLKEVLKNKKAKEIIKGLLSFVDSLGNYSGGIFAKAEQFLKDSEVEK